MTDFNDHNQEIQNAIDAAKKEVDNFIDSTSDVIADIYDPTRIQKRIIDEAKKKLQSKRENWTSTDFGLSGLKSLSSNCQKMLSSSSVDVSSVPLSSLSLSVGSLETQQETNIVIPVETVDDVDVDVDDIPVTKTRKNRPTQAEMLERLKNQKA